MIIDCNPCRIHGTANIDITAHGELFKPTPNVVAKIEIVQNSIFNVTTYMDRGIDTIERKNLFIIPLGNYYEPYN